jgi:hypothetical protein
MRYLLVVACCGLAVAAVRADIYTVGGRDSSAKAPFSAC